MREPICFEVKRRARQSERLGSSSRRVGARFAYVGGRARQGELNEGAHLFRSKERGSSERATGLVFIKSGSSSACVGGRARQ